MRMNPTNPQKPGSSVEILKAHIGELAIRNLDNDWIKENKLDLGPLMEDKHSVLLPKDDIR